MIDASIQCSPIGGESAAFILGQVSSSLDKFDELDSSTIVRSLFGIKASEPSALDVTQALVRCVGQENATTIRNYLADRGRSGIIWRFTSSKLFMVEFSKVIVSEGSNFLSLSLIYVNDKDNDGTTMTIVRELVRFSGQGITFIDKSSKRMVSAIEPHDYLMKIRDEVIRKLESEVIAKATKEIRTGSPLPPPKENEMKTLNSSMKIDIQHNGIFASDIFQRANELLQENLPVEQIDVFKSRLSSFFNSTWEWSIKIDKESVVDTTSPTMYRDTYILRIGAFVPVVVEPKEQPTQDQRAEAEAEQHRRDVAGQIAAAEVAAEDLHQEGKHEEAAAIEQRTEEVKQELNIVPDSNMNPDALPPPNPDDYDDVIVAIHQGVIVDFTAINDDEIAVHPTGEDGQALATFADADFKSLFKPYRSYMAKCDITNGMLREKSASEILEMFDEIASAETSTSENKEPQQEEKKMEYKFEISEGLSDIQHIIEDTVNEFLTSRPDASETDITEDLRTVTEMDNITVHITKTDDCTVVAVDDPGQPAPPAEEVTEEIPSVDIHDPVIQGKLLSGLFGTSEPAITHVERFLKNHLTEEGNKGFLATKGTIPTETTIIYTRKPYDVTYCIVKMKDGRFYRIFAAITNLGLSEHGWVETNDIPDRWVQIGHDIQNTIMKNEFRSGRRY